MPITATTPARRVAVFGISSTSTLVKKSMIAATDIITISMTIGMPSAAFRPRQRAQTGEETEQHDERHAREEQERGQSWLKP